MADCYLVGRFVCFAFACGLDLLSLVNSVVIGVFGMIVLSCCLCLAG